VGSDIPIQPKSNPESGILMPPKTKVKVRTKAKPKASRKTTRNASTRPVALKPKPEPAKKITKPLARIDSPPRKPTSIVGRSVNDPNLSSFIWSVADLLRGDYKQSEYGKVILPFTVLRRLDCVLEATKPAVLAEFEKQQKAGRNPDAFLIRKSGQLFYNTSPLDMKKLMGDQDHIKENLFAYMQGFSASVRDIFESFDFHTCDPSSALFVAQRELSRPGVVLERHSRCHGRTEDRFHAKRR
jgi:hypothetical protein